MKVQKLLAVACMLNVISSSAQAVVIPPQYIQQATDAVAADSTLLSKWMTSQLKYAIPFNSTAGDVVPQQLKIFGFEVGVEGVVTGTQLDVDGFHSLPTTLVKTNTIQMYDRLPFPMALGHAKIGLPFGIDAGVRVGGIPEKSMSNDNTQFKIKNKVVGLDLRKKIVEEGTLKPGLTFGLNYTHADGSLDLTSSNVGLNSYTTSDGHSIAVSNAVVAEHSDWKTNSVGIQAILDKKILIITPYIGAAVNHNSGNINNSITTSGTASDTADLPGVTQSLSAIGSSTDAANKWDIRGLAGFELTILPFVRLGVGGEYAGAKNVAGNVGLRIQFR